MRPHQDQKGPLDAKEKLGSPGPQFEQKGKIAENQGKRQEYPDKMLLFFMEAPHPMRQKNIYHRKHRAG